MVNFYDKVRQYPDYCRQFTCGQSLITVFNCPIDARLMTTRFSDLYSQHNYIFYVIEGRKTWHASNGSFDFQQGSCVFVRKGACIIEQFMDVGFCLVLFFIPDDFVIDTLRITHSAQQGLPSSHDPVMVLETNESLEAFFLSMSTYFRDTREPNEALLELKFRELILTLADHPGNACLPAYFNSLYHEPQAASLVRVMEDNFCFNLTLHQYAELCNRSLSAFKRDFQKQYQRTPGKWLLRKRLDHARNLLTAFDKTVSTAAFESGFESAAHFSRSFKQQFGVPPQAIRKTPV